MIMLWVDGILDSILETNKPDCCITPRTVEQEKVFNFVSITESACSFFTSKSIWAGFLPLVRRCVRNFKLSFRGGAVRHYSP